MFIYFFLISQSSYYSLHCNNLIVLAYLAIQNAKLPSSLVVGVGFCTYVVLVLIVEVTPLSSSFLTLVICFYKLQEQVRSGDASATELFELGAVMLRRKFYPASTKYLLQAIEKWDGDDQDLAQV